MPLSSNQESYKNTIKPVRGRNTQFLYSASSKTDLVEYHEYASNEDGARVILFRFISEREKITKEYIKKMEEGSRSHTMEGLQRNMKTFGLIVLETNLGIDAQGVYRYYKARWSIETYYDRIKHSIDFSELNLSEYGMVQAVAFVMLLTGRIDPRILSAAKSVGKSGKDLVRLMSALKLYDNGKSCNICNAKKEHFALAEKLGLSYDTTRKCLG